MSSIRTRIKLAFVLMCGACNPTTPARVEAPADTAAGEIDFDMAGPNEAAMLVPVEINGRPELDFVLDTGATLTCVDVSLARELNLPKQPIGGTAIGVRGVGQIETVRIDSLRIGGAVAYDLLACSIDLAALRSGMKAHGLIGLNFLKSFKVAIDFDRNVLTLTARETER